MKLPPTTRVPFDCAVFALGIALWALPTAGSAQQAADPAAGVASQNFEAVSDHLDLGGSVFAYRNLSGKAEAVAEMLQAIVTTLPPADVPNDMLARVKALEFKELMKDLGLTNLEAAGISSMRVGDGFRNKLYLHVPGGRRGVLRLLGRDAAPFASAKIAPSDADLVIEREINLTEVYRVGRDLVAQLKVPEAERGWKQMMGQKVADLGFTVGDMLQKLDTRLLVIGRVSDTETFELPDVPVEVPKFDLYVSLDGMAWLAEKLLAKLPPEAADALVVGEGFKTLNFPPMPPDAPLMQPVMRVDAETKRVTFASSQAFLDECLAGRGGLFESEPFKAATAGLPKEGNALVYISPDIGRHSEALLRAALAAEDGLQLDAINMIADRVDEVLPLMRDSYARVSANLPDGVLVVSNSPASWKQALVILPAMAVLPIGFFSGSRAVQKF